jgi:hypothetical protein
MKKAAKKLRVARETVIHLVNLKEVVGGASSQNTRSCGDSCDCSFSCDANQ